MAGMYAPGQVTVMMAENVSADDARLLFSELGLTIATDFLLPHRPMFTLSVPEGEEMLWIKKLRADPRIAFAHLNRVYNLT